MNDSNKKCKAVQHDSLVAVSVPPFRVEFVDGSILHGFDSLYKAISTAACDVGGRPSRIIDSNGLLLHEANKKSTLSKRAQRAITEWVRATSQSGRKSVSNEPQKGRLSRNQKKKHREMEMEKSLRDREFISKMTHGHLESPTIEKSKYGIENFVRKVDGSFESGARR